jgi:hypothetical protein
MDALGEVEYVSQSKPSRRMGGLVVNGVNPGFDAGGTIAMLNDAIAGVGLVRIETIPAHWHLAHIPLRGNVPAKWVAGGIPLNLTSGEADLSSSIGQKLTAVPFDDGEFQGLSVSGFRPFEIAVYPNEIVDVGGVVARAYVKSVADGDGVALLRVNAPIPAGGDILIGVAESVVYRIQDFPRSKRSIGSQHTFDFQFREVFEKLDDPFEEFDPWVPT